MKICQDEEVIGQESPDTGPCHSQEPLEEHGDPPINTCEESPFQTGHDTGQEESSDEQLSEEEDLEERSTGRLIRAVSCLDLTSLALLDTSPLPPTPSFDSSPTLPPLSSRPPLSHPFVPHKTPPAPRFVPSPLPPTPSFQSSPTLQPLSSRPPLSHPFVPHKPPPAPRFVPSPLPPTPFFQLSPTLMEEVEEEEIWL
ncbi:hypothetical protein XENTR_v10020231 [Xenopus tropicalis]|nr:hypothetical protein XENTR_v10020231 [Xenopus tropicalis]